MGWNEDEATRLRTPDELLKAAQPLIDWINAVYPHPHVTVHVDKFGAVAETGDVAAMVKVTP